MARYDRVRGYTIPGPSLYEYLVGIFPQYRDNVIEESIFLVRQGGSIQQYVIFNTSEPIQIAEVAGGWRKDSDGRWRLVGENIGKPASNYGPQSSGMEEYKAFAMRIEDANRLGLFAASVAESIEPDISTLEEERDRASTAREYLRQEEEEDRWRNEVALFDDLSAGLGSVTAGIVNFTGRIFGKTVAGFVGSLGPYGVLAITIAAGAATAYYVVPLVKAAKRGQ